MVAASAKTQHNVEIADYLRREIMAGALTTGDPLPTEAELCRRFTSSRGPVRQAMAALRAEGLVSSGRGRRSVVLDRVPSQSFDGVLSFTEWSRGVGITPGQQTLLVIKQPAAAAVAAALEIPADSPVVLVKRLRLMNGQPAMVERLRYPLEIGRHILDFDPDSGSLYQRLIDCGVDISRATRVLDAIGASSEDAALLGVADGSPLLRVRRRAFTGEGVPVEVSDDHYLPNMANFTLNSTRGTPTPLTMRSGE
ncbi:GntR family transcriptional regulator [Corynebacterium sp. A21]|uniref:GntR family transcriptional regulator n=1 Tax=Corynebacterium sp. A21 TaxID=3457318 RepID=UPI003FD60370